jgi:hypothetical protein
MNYSRNQGKKSLNRTKTIGLGGILIGLSSLCSCSTDNQNPALDSINNKALPAEEHQIELFHAGNIASPTKMWVEVLDSKLLGRDYYLIANSDAANQDLTVAKLHVSNMAFGNSISVKIIDNALPLSAPALLTLTVDSNGVTPITLPVYLIQNFPVAGVSLKAVEQVEYSEATSAQLVPSNFKVQGSQLFYPCLSLALANQGNKVFDITETGASGSITNNISGGVVANNGVSSVVANLRTNQGPMVQNCAVDVLTTQFSNSQVGYDVWEQINDGSNGATDGSSDFLSLLAGNLIGGYNILVTNTSGTPIMKSVDIDMGRVTGNIGTTDMSDYVLASYSTINASQIVMNADNLNFGYPIMQNIPLETGIDAPTSMKYSETERIYLEDLNADGKDDALLMNSRDGSTSGNGRCHFGMRLMLNTTDFTNVTTMSNPTFREVTRSNLLDYNGAQYSVGTGCTSAIGYNNSAPESINRYPIAAAFGDLNNDGIMDMVVVGGQPLNLDPHLDYSTPGIEYYINSNQDLNSDGMMEFHAGNPSSPILPGIYAYNSNLATDVEIIENNSWEYVKMNYWQRLVVVAFADRDPVVWAQDLTTHLWVEVTATSYANPLNLHGRYQNISPTWVARGTAGGLDAKEFMGVNGELVAGNNSLYLGVNTAGPGTYNVSQISLANLTNQLQAAPMIPFLNGIWNDVRLVPIQGVFHRDYHGTGASACNPWSNAANFTNCQLQNVQPVYNMGIFTTARSSGGYSNGVNARTSYLWAIERW